jgi:uncharacterized protein YaaR (DUF327 family)
MAKVDTGDLPSFYMNPQAYSQVKSDAKKEKGIRRTGERSFSRVFQDIRGKTAEELGPLVNMPVSEETVNFLMDEVRSAGSALLDRPLPDEIMRYKQAVRNFMHYVVKNGYTVEHEAGIPKFLKPGYQGSRGTPESQEQKRYVKVQVIDKKLEDMAAMLLAGQKDRLKLTARLEEINGLLVDLLQ